MSATPIRQVQLVGRKIRKLRKERRLTQTELSARIGVPQSDLSRMERGEYRVSLDTLFRILGEFGMSIGEFFGDPGGLRNGRHLPPRQARLVREFRGLDGEAQREVEEFIRFKQHQRHQPRPVGDEEARP